MTYGLLFNNSPLAWAPPLLSTLARTVVFKRVPLTGINLLKTERPNPGYHNRHLPIMTPTRAAVSWVARKQSVSLPTTTMPRTAETASFKVIFYSLLFTAGTDWNAQFNHTMIRVKDPKVSLAFYQDVMRSLVNSNTFICLNWMFFFTDSWDGFPLWYPPIIDLTVSNRSDLPLIN